MISPTYGLGKKIKNTLQHYAGRAMAICLITIEYGVIFADLLILPFTFIIFTLSAGTSPFIFRMTIMGSSSCHL